MIIKSLFIEILRRVNHAYGIKTFGPATDETKDMSLARMDTVNILGQLVLKLTSKPNRKWSQGIKPLIGLIAVEQRALE